MADRHASLYQGDGDPALPEGPAFDDQDPAKHPQIASLSSLTDDQKTGLREEYRERLRALASVDEAVAAIVSELAAQGELSNTLLLYTTDNGWMQGEHRIPKGKIKVYEPSAGVPLLMRGPGVPQGHTVKTAVSNVDIGATILDAADANPTAVVDGQSLVPIAQPSAYHLDRAVPLETATSTPLVPEVFSLVGDPVAKPFYAAVRTRRYTYVEYFEQPDSNGETTIRHRELYDHQVDPEQTQNRAIQRDDCLTSPNDLECVKGNDARSYGPQQNRLQIALDKLRTCSGAAPSPTPGTCNVAVSIPHPS